MTSTSPTAASVGGGPYKQGTASGRRAARRTVATHTTHYGLCARSPRCRGCKGTHISPGVSLSPLSARHKRSGRVGAQRQLRSPRISACVAPAASKAGHSVERCLHLLRSRSHAPLAPRKPVGRRSVPKAAMHNATEPGRASYSQ
eukprot:624967-Prymnesium_polylepis.2